MPNLPTGIHSTARTARQRPNPQDSAPTDCAQNAPQAGQTGQPQLPALNTVTALALLLLRRVRMRLNSGQVITSQAGQFASADPARHRGQRPAH